LFLICRDNSISLSKIKEGIKLTKKREENKDQVWWLTPAIPATQEAEI
jgi:hypothetical protein